MADMDLVRYLEKIINKKSLYLVNSKKEMIDLKERIKKLEIEKSELEAMKESRSWRLIQRMKNILNAVGILPYLQKKTYKPEEILDIDDRITRNFLSMPEYKFLKYKSVYDSKYKIDLSKVDYNLEKDLISIVLPVYNGEDYVAASIESVLAQTYKNFEFIIINDGSTDNTEKILKHYEALDPRIKVVHQKNIKLPKTLSRGFRLARGEFCTWTSADNIMHKNFLEILLQELKNNINVGMVFANIRLIDEKGNPITNNGWYPNSEKAEIVMLPFKVLDLNTVANNFIGAAFMYRGIISKIVGDYSEYKYTTEDYDYWMRINELFSIEHVKAEIPIYDYRIHRNSLTAQDKELKISENRYKLMLLDDFRRNYHLQPMVWIVDQNEVNGFYRKVVSDIQKLGHVIIFSEKISDYSFQKEHHNCVYLSCSALKSPDILFSDNVYKILLLEYPGAFLAEGWNDCIYFGDITDKSFKCNKCFVVQDSGELVKLINCRAKTFYLSSFEKKMEMKEEYEKKVSVVILAESSVSDLESVLISLLNQSFDRAGYEILVCVDASFYKMAKALSDKLTDTYSLNKKFMQVLTSPQRNMNKINFAGWNARGEIVAFIDTYCALENDYLQNLYYTFYISPEVGACFGEVEIRTDEKLLPEERKLFSEFVISEEQDLEEMDINSDEVTIVNFSLRRSLFYSTGGIRTATIEHEINGDDQYLKTMLKQLKLFGKSIICSSIVKVQRNVISQCNVKEILERKIQKEVFDQYLLYDEEINENSKILNIEWQINEIRQKITQVSKNQIILKYYLELKITILEDLKQIIKEDQLNRQRLLNNRK